MINPPVNKAKKRHSMCLFSCFFFGFIKDFKQGSLNANERTTTQPSQMQPAKRRSLIWKDLVTRSPVPQSKRATVVGRFKI